MPVFLKVGETEPEDAIEFASILAAARAYRAAALRFPGGFVCDAALFLARGNRELGAVPDFTLDLTPRGTVRVHQVRG